jgi:hypothetical protein
VFLPYLYGERAPVWDAKSSGAFININFKHQQQHFLRAALEGICFALNDVLNAVEESSDPIEEIVISGGFISSPPGCSYWPILPVKSWFCCNLRCIGYRRYLFGHGSAWMLILKR